MAIKKALETHLAKSDGTTIKQHIDGLLHQFEVFEKFYPKVLNEKEKQVLKIAIEYHDYGKLNRLFQCKLPVKQRTVKCSGERDDRIPHQYLSPLFLRPLSEKFSKLDVIKIVYAIINHHARGSKYIKGDYAGIDLLLSEIKGNFKDFFSHLGYTKISDETIKFYKKCLTHIIENLGAVKNLNRTFRENPEFVKSVVKLAGLLIKIDHAASGEDLIVEEEPVKGNRERLFLNYLRSQNKLSKLKPFQEKFKDYKNLVLVADTGLGKTGLAVLWSKRKMFYVLPNRTSTNAMFETMKEIFGESKAGLLHSTSLFYVYENAEKEDYTILRDFDNTRNLSKPVTISTADQLFTSVFKYPTYEKTYATLSYSDVVIDEIQGFEPAQIVPMLRQIEETVKLGTRYLIITATLPEIIKNEFEKMGFTVKTNDPETIDKTRRHKVKILEKDIFSVKDDILEKATKDKNILVITNTVSTAQDLYLKLSENLADEHIKVKLLHSRFIWKTRKEKENEIKEDYRKFKRNIWITTQLVEASLDIDFDVLFTEAAPADSLIQRMGRVWRHKNEDYPEEEFNVYILSIVNEKKDVYEKVLREKSLDLIEKYLTEKGFLLSENKRKIVEILYSEETLTSLNSKYFDEWKKVEKILNSEWEYLFKSEAHKIFRDIFTFEAIPFVFKEKIKNLVEDYKETKEIVGKSKRKLKRLKILKGINDYKIPVPVYWVLNEKVKNKTPFEVLDKDLNLYILAKYFKYDDNLGIRLDKKELEKNDINKEIFI